MTDQTTTENGSTAGAVSASSPRVADAVPATSSRAAGWDLLLLSMIALFLELAVIRWLSTEIRIFAYFKNLVLMGAFLGFGVGFFLHRKSEQLLRWFPVLFFVLVVVIAGAHHLGITHVIFVDPRQYFLLGTGFGDHALESIPSILKTVKALFVIVSVFFLVMATFAALAAKIGALMERLRPLPGYSINVLGSLLGIVGFSLVAHLEWSPVIWLIFVCLPLLRFYRGAMMLPAVLFGVSLVFALWMQLANPAVWSPYYRISLSQTMSDPPQFVVNVNYDGFQSFQDLSDKYLSTYPERVRRAQYRHYDIPFAMSEKPIESVLILGGGAGNDAAAALRNGAQIVDVVEIDPVIARVGRELHPERPYSSDKVRLHIDDARSFLQKTDRKYDLVIFATLDSHTVFSSLSSLRLDNFVFTRESLERAKDLLNPHGGIASNFFATKGWLLQRHLKTLQEVTGQAPIMFGYADYQEVILLAGDRFDEGRSPGTTGYVPFEGPPLAEMIESTSDDWPFLFLEKRGIPFHYLLPLGIIFIVALVPVRMSGIAIAKVDWHLFFMGAAFLLIETKAITGLALIFGSTWTVNSVVISAVLVTILVANFLAAWSSRLGFTVLYVGLCAALLLNYFFPFDVLNQYDWSVRLIVSSAIIGSPLFFAAFIFAEAFSVVVSPSLSLASNLLGGLVGGLLEYVDMWSGLRSLNLIALLLYLASWWFLVSRRAPAIERAL